MWDSEKGRTDIECSCTTGWLGARLHQGRDTECRQVSRRSDCPAVALVAGVRVTNSPVWVSSAAVGRLRESSVIPWEALWASPLTADVVCSPVVTLLAAFARCGVPAMFTTKNQPKWLTKDGEAQVDVPWSVWPFLRVTAPSSLIRYWWTDVVRRRKWGRRMMLTGEGACGMVVTNGYQNSSVWKAMKGKLMHKVLQTFSGLQCQKTGARPSCSCLSTTRPNCVQPMRNVCLAHNPLAFCSA
jgi:hypothetical protein